MALPNLKDLKKLAQVCRKAGITSFKMHQDQSYEFQLDTNYEIAKPSTKKAKETTSYPSDTKFETDSLTESELLLWSVRDPSQEQQETQTTQS